MEEEKGFKSLHEQKLEKRIEELNTLLRSVFKDADKIKITEVSETVKKLEMEIIKRDEKLKMADLKIKALNNQVVELTTFRNELTSRNIELESKLYEQKLDQTLLTVKLEGSEKENACIMRNLKETLDLQTENTKELAIKVKQQVEEKKNLIEEIEAIQIENADLRELLDSSENELKLEREDKARNLIDFERKLQEVESKFIEVTAQKNELETQMLKIEDQHKKVIRNVQELLGFAAREENMEKKETSKNAVHDSCFSEPSGSFESESTIIESAKRPERKRKQRNLNVEIRKLRRTSTSILQEPMQNGNQDESFDLSGIE